MSHEEPEASPLLKTTLTNSALLALFAVFTSLLLGLTFVGTKDAIQSSKLKMEQKALLQVIGNTAFDNNLVTDSIALSTSIQQMLNVTKQASIRVIRNKGNIVGYILPSVAPDGYSGKISLLLALDVSGEIIGVRTIDHKETPGLGDKIDIKKSDWVLHFSGLSLQNTPETNWAVKKDGGQFDAFSGATITPRAFVNAVYQTLKTYEANQKVIEQQAVIAAKDIGGQLINKLNPQEARP